MLVYRLALVGLGGVGSAKQEWRCVAAVVISMLLLSTGAAVAASRSPNPTKAAQACAAGRSIAAHLGAMDEHYVAKFVRCMLRQERTQIGLNYEQTASLDRAMSGALQKMDASSVGYGKASIRLQNSLLDKLVMRTCRRRGWLWDGDIGDTNPPPPLTPIAIAKVNAQLFDEGTAVMRVPTARFGFAVRHDLLFHGNDRHGVSFAYIAVYCY